MYETYLKDCYWVPHPMGVPHDRHSPFARDEPCPDGSRGPLAGRGGGGCGLRCSIGDGGGMESSTLRQCGTRPKRPYFEHGSEEAKGCMVAALANVSNVVDRSGKTPARRV